MNFAVRFAGAVGMILVSLSSSQSFGFKPLRDIQRLLELQRPCSPIHRLPQELPQKDVEDHRHIIDQTAQAMELIDWQVHLLEEEIARRSAAEPSQDSTMYSEFGSLGQLEQARLQELILAFQILERSSGRSERVKTCGSAKWRPKPAELQNLFSGLNLQMIELAENLEDVLSKIPTDDVRGLLVEFREAREDVIIIQKRSSGLIEIHRARRSLNPNFEEFERGPAYVN